ncbi:uncharacterized protein TRUGW13939_08343 [Talaromyces rugulosus]|uniref:Uncharacterized protein n=1 Tax=Talaromyces rugulosus TaxID=121627 RepID=A0A7H8R4W0_TALRU|nr:uncharacterized protein TRUGW13939_08343 [Talaromyces rugulosus]QKX61196.1 hypothetical protein TRUGW13939_08343 [Talaromyces rugulosus]
MASVTLRLRTRLEALWKTVLDYKKMDEILLQHNAIPDEFLSDNKIRLISHGFERADDDHPIDWEQGPTIFRAYSTPASSEPEFKEYIPPGDDCDHVYDSPSSPMNCAMFLAYGHLDKWVFGGFRRKNFPQRHISSHPKPRTAQWHNQGQSDFAHDGSIMHGELTQLVTAMRNRAYQPVKKRKDNDEDTYSDSNDYDDDDDYSDSEDDIKPPEFAFKYEQRFPVLMVSLVGPQHARIYTLVWMVRTWLLDNHAYTALKKEKCALGLLYKLPRKYTARRSLTMGYDLRYMVTFQLDI